MRATPADYLSHLQALLPPGAAWPREPAAVLTAVLSGLAGGMAGAHNRALDLIEEADPRTTAELLADWERVAGLPDICTAGLALTIEERRAALVARLTARGGQSRAYFTGLAGALGWPGATVAEFPPFTAGSPATAAVNGTAWGHAWRLHVADEGGRRWFDAGSACTAGVRGWGRPLLECAVRRLAPGHTRVRFGYGVPSAPPPRPPGTIPFRTLGLQGGLTLRMWVGGVLMIRESGE